MVDLLLGRFTGEMMQRFAHEDQIAAPELIDPEVLNVMRKAVLAGKLSAQRATQAVRDMATSPIRRFPHHPLAIRIWGYRDNFSSYDACYVCLAESLDAALWTTDRRLHKAITKHDACSAELIGNS